jgi:hypothetical protein
MLIIAISAIVLTAVGATLAYIIAKTPSRENEFIPTSVSCEINGSLDSLSEMNTAVKNTGSISAYVRAVIVVCWTRIDNGNVYGTMPVSEVDYKINVGSGRWTLARDGYYYYADKVAASALTEILVASVDVLSDAPDGYTLSVKIVASAVQAEPSRAVEELWGVSVLDNGSILVP